jgi:carboxymethylenebutenolidase
MPDLQIPHQNETLLTYVAQPSTTGPWPGVVVIHDAVGMSTDVRNQCDWLASEGYLAAAPDLFAGKTFFSCVFKVIREIKNKRGSLFDKVETVRQHLLHDPQSNGKAGVIGFCFGGGFAFVLSTGFGFDTASINYGGTLPKDAETVLESACPIVASYGALDRGSRGAAEHLERILTEYGIDHDVKEYADTDHAFMNDHDLAEVPWFIKFIGYAFGGGAYHPESTLDARKRIVAFFDKHLQGGS